MGRGISEKKMQLKITLKNYFLNHSIIKSGNYNFLKKMTAEYFGSGEM